MKFRLARLLQKEIERLTNAYALAREIEKTNKQVGRTVVINHRALLKLAKGDKKVFLTVDLLVTLDVYFSKLGESLRAKPIFEQEGVMEPLLEVGKITFLLGSKALKTERLRDMSTWDARAMAEMLNKATKFEKHIRYRMREVLLRENMTLEKAASEPWFHVLQADQRSVVAIAAPAANPATEVVLARCFRREPFRSPKVPFDGVNRLPFYFVWPENSLVKGFRSAFALTWQQLSQSGLPKAANAAKAVRSGKARAFVLGNDVEIVPVDAKQWKMYGTIVAQRREDGNVWLALCGLTGPATYGAAQLVQKVHAELPWPEERRSPLLWAPIVAEVVCKDSRDEYGDARELVSCKFLQAPQVWRPSQDTAS